VRRPSTLVFLLAGVAVALVLAFVVSPVASGNPDGLEKVAADKGLDRDVRDHALADGPLAGYSVRGVDDDGLSTGVAGVIGVIVTFAAGCGMLLVTRAIRRRGDHAAGP
jgi:cobalt/nickel transport system permease protein